MTTDPIYKSYMQLCMHIDGSQSLYLRIPTVWDDERKLWIGLIKTPKLQRLIYGEGENSFKLQNSFNLNLKKILEKNDELADDAFSLFQPLSYWDEMYDAN